MSEQTRRATTTSLAEMLYPGTDRTGRAGVAYRGPYTGGSDAPAGGTPDQGNTVWRLLRSAAARLAALRPRWAVVDDLAGMSDRDLADVGLSRPLPRPAPEPGTALADTWRAHLPGSRAVTPGMGAHR